MREGHAGKDVSFSSLALVAGFLTSHWTEVVTYFGGTFCIQSWFLDIVPEAAVLSVCLGCFFLIHATPSHLPGPCVGIIIIIKNRTHKKTPPTTNLILVGGRYHLFFIQEFSMYAWQ